MAGSEILRGWEESGCGIKNDKKRDPYSDGKSIILTVSMSIFLKYCCDTVL